MNIFDIGIILLLLMFIIVGFKNGVVKELASLIGIIIVFYISFLLKGYIGNFLCLVFPFFNFYGPIEGMTSLNILLYQAIAFILVFSLLLGVYAFILKISKFLQKIVNMTIVLWLPSKMLGGVIGFISGLIFLYVILVLLMIPIGNHPIYSESKLVDKIVYHMPVLSQTTSKFNKAIQDIAVLKNRVVNKAISINETNLDAIDIMLESNITNKSTIEKLIKLHRLDNIRNIDSILNKY